MSNVIHYDDWKWNDVIVSLVYSFYNLNKNMILIISIKWTNELNVLYLKSGLRIHLLFSSNNDIQTKIIQLPTNRLKRYSGRDIWYDHIIIEYIAHKLICNSNEFNNQPILLKYVYGFNNNASSLSINRIAKRGLPTFMSTLYQFP